MDVHMGIFMIRKGVRSAYHRVHIVLALDSMMIFVTFVETVSNRIRRVQAVYLVLIESYFVKKLIKTNTTLAIEGIIGLKMDR